MSLSAMPNINDAILYFINAASGQFVFLDWIFIAITTYLVYAVFIGVGAYIFVYIPLKTTDPFARLRVLARAGEMAIAVFSTWIIVHAIKIIVALPRPADVLADINVLSSVNSYSFPSGHAALTCALATTVYFHHRRLGTLLYAFSLLVALSRMYVGVHYPLDVGVGLLLGYVIAKIFHSTFRRREAVAQKS